MTRSRHRGRVGSDPHTLAQPPRQELSRPVGILRNPVDRHEELVRELKSEDAADIEIHGSIPVFAGRPKPAGPPNVCKEIANQLLMVLVGTLMAG